MINFARLFRSFALASLLAIVATGAVARQVAAPIEEQPGASIGYPTVAAARANLSARPDVTLADQGGWTIATEATSHTLWSFAPAGDPAYPAVVRRQIVKNEDGVAVKMTVLCEAEKQPCDNLVRTFQAMNAAIKAQLDAKRR